MLEVHGPSPSHIICTIFLKKTRQNNTVVTKEDASSISNNEWNIRNWSAKICQKLDNKISKVAHTILRITGIANLMILQKKKGSAFINEQDEMP